jgi:plasmid stability protein
MRSTCAHVARMSTMIQIRNVPDDLHRKLKSRAALEGRSLSDYLLREIAEIAARPSLEEWRARLASREPVDLDDETVAFLRAEREAR